MLVCAFMGTGRMQAAYRHAMASGYRFFSYGDASFLLPGRAPKNQPLTQMRLPIRESVAILQSIPT